MAEATSGIWRKTAMTKPFAGDSWPDGRLGKGQARCSVGSFTCRRSSRTSRRRGFRQAWTVTGKATNKARQLARQGNRAMEGELA